MSTYLPTLKQLQYLVALHEHGHFGRAADACFVSQSTLSAGLRDLETLLGVVLVERTKRAVRFTPLGNAVGVGLQASWVIDLWGQSAAEDASARARQQAAEAGWHQARVLVAAELAQLYVAQRLCQAQLAVARSDRDSRAATARSSAVTRPTSRAAITRLASSGEVSSVMVV